MNLSSLTTFLHPSAQNWATEARVLRWMTLLWLLVGLIVLFSASYYLGVVQSQDGLFFFKRQLLWTVLGLIGFSYIIHSPLERLLRVTPVAFLGLLLLIFATRLPGIGVGVDDASRWIALGPVRIQPSELMKPVLILQAALTFGRWFKLTPRDRLAWLSLFAVVLGGILIQPNLSTAALCGIALWLIALAAGISYSSLSITALSGVGLAALSISMVAYQRRRVLCFLDPFSDENKQDCAFQLTQSLFAIGSGGVWGEGFGQSQAKLSYLPIPHTDFIFSIFAEEWGLIGAGVLLLWLAAYCILALRVSLKTAHPLHRLIAIGAMVFIIGQSLINLGVTTGVLPTTGLPLPFFSYGGSSIIASLLISGLLIRVARESHEADVIPLGLDRKIPVWDRSSPRLPTLQTDSSPSTPRSRPDRSSNRRFQRPKAKNWFAKKQRPPPTTETENKSSLRSPRKPRRSRTLKNPFQSKGQRPQKGLKRPSSQSRRRRMHRRKPR